MLVPTKCSPEQKLIAVQDYLSNKRSAYKIVKDINVRPGTVFQWLKNYFEISSYFNKIVFCISRIKQNFMLFCWQPVITNLQFEI